MLRKLRSRITYANVVATLALFVAVGTGGAYAANTVFSSDIADGEVKTADIGNGEVKSSDVKDESLTTFDVSTFLGADVVDGSLTGADISDNTIGVNDIGSQQVGPDEVINDSLLQSDIRAGAVTNDEVLDNSLISADITDNSLTGTDINESTLNLPQTPTIARFANILGHAVRIGENTWTNVALGSLGPGSWAITADIQFEATPYPFETQGRMVGTTCELRAAETHDSPFIGGNSDRRWRPASQTTISTISMNGGAQIGVGGSGAVSVWCRSDQFENVSGQLMGVRLDGF